MLEMEVFPLSPEEKQPILEKLECSEFKENLKILEDWYKKQPHFPQNIQYDYILRRILSGSKSSVERAKRKTEAYFTHKAINRNEFSIYLGPTYVLPSKNDVTCVALPKLGPLGERILIMELKRPTADDFHFDHYIQTSFLMHEISLKFDLCNKSRFVGIAKNLTMDHMKKFDFARLYRHLMMTFEGYSYEMVSIDVIGLTKPLQILLGIVKKIVKAKIFKRITIYENLEAFNKVIGKEYLPQELGGTQASIKFLKDSLDPIMEQYKKYLSECGNISAIEGKRIGPVKNYDLYGMDGTFKKLILD